MNNKVKRISNREVRRRGLDIATRCPSFHKSQGVREMRKHFDPLYPVRYGDLIYNVPREIYDSI